MPGPRWPWRADRLAAFMLLQHDATCSARRLRRLAWGKRRDSVRQDPDASSRSMQALEYYAQE
jgi:hypothetical protein